MPLATPDDAVRFGYDPVAVAPVLARAETRVRSYLSGRTSAVGMLASPTAPDAVAELVVAVAHRMAATSPQIARGVTSEQSMNEQVSFGGQAFTGVVDLTDTEKRRLDQLYPRLPHSEDILP